MRYAQRGGYTPAEQQRRERLRLEAAGRFARGDTIKEIAHDLRVTEGSVRRWHRAWRDGGAGALRSRGPVSAGAAEPAAVGPAGGRTEEGPAGARVRRGPALDAGPDQDADRQAVPRRLHRRGHLEADAPARLAGPGAGPPGDGTRRGGGRSVEGRGVAADKSAARDLGAFICFEDEAGQGLRPPKGRTWAPRGARPLVRVRGAGGGRVSIAGVACYRPGDRPHLFYTLLVYRRRKGEAKGFTWADYRDLIIATHHNLSAPLVWCWDNLNIHLAPELADFAEENKEWLRVYRLPAYTPDLNPAEGIWSLLKRAMVNFAAADLDGLVRIIKRKLKKIQYRPHLIDGCLAATGLKIEPW